MGSQLGLYLVDHEAEIPFQYPHSVRPVTSVYLFSFAKLTVQNFASSAQSRCNAACSHRLNLRSRSIQFWKDIGPSNRESGNEGEALNGRIHRSRLRSNRTGCKTRGVSRVQNGNNRHRNVTHFCPKLEHYEGLSAGRLQHACLVHHALVTAVAQEQY